MDIIELTDLLVTSSESSNLDRYIPWWDNSREEETYRNPFFREEVVREAEACLETCGTEDLLEPAGHYGLSLFHLLVWHNFYDMVEKMLCDGRVGEEVNLPDWGEYGVTPFLLACLRGNLAMVHLLLDHGADPAACDRRGRNAYHYLADPTFEGLTADFFSKERSLEQRADIARLLDLDINREDGEGMTPLARMLSRSNNPHFTWPLTEVFLKKGAKTDYVDPNGNTLLLLAVKNEHFTAALVLMEQCGEMVNMADREGMTPIRYAAEYGLDALELALADHGAKPERNRRPDTELLCEITNRAFGRISGDKRDGLGLALYAARKLLRQADLEDDDELAQIIDLVANALKVDRECRILDLCREAGIDFTAPVWDGDDTVCLRDACLGAGGRTNVVGKLLELGVDLNKAVVKGRTPALIIASMEKEWGEKKEVFFEKVTAFFSRESMEQTDYEGMAAIHLAVRNGHSGMLKVMIQKGVDVNLTEDLPGKAGATPLHEACAWGCVEAVKMLMGAGSDDTLKDVDGETPAHYAVRKKRGSGRELTGQERAGLLRELVHVDIPGEDGNTPLLLLSDIGEIQELLPILIEKGADVNRANRQAQTLMMLRTDKDTVKELLRAGADLNKADNHGNTALHYALESGNAETACYLIRKGADYSRANNQGRTPGQMATEAGYDSVLALMQ